MLVTFLCRFWIIFDPTHENEEEHCLRVRFFVFLTRSGTTIKRRNVPTTISSLKVFSRDSNDTENLQMMFINVEQKRLRIFGFWSIAIE